MGSVLASKPPHSGIGASQPPSIVSQYAVSYNRKPVGSGDSHSKSATEAGKDVNGTSPSPASGTGAPMLSANSAAAPIPFSPTSSEFSEAATGSDYQSDAIKSWDEKRVGEWLRGINCAQYEHMFKVNNVTGSNLIECDQAVLKEMGIKKIGDRVRIFVAIKTLRSRAMGSARRRNRDSLAALDARQLHNSFAPSAAGSPRHIANARDNGSNKRWSRQVDLAAVQDYHAASANARPISPADNNNNNNNNNNNDSSKKGIRPQRHGGMSPMPTATSARDKPSNGAGGAYFNPAPTSGKTGLRPATPSTATTVRIQNPAAADTTVGKLPMGSPVIRVIFERGQTKVLDIKACKSVEDILASVLRKVQINDTQVRNWCFWNLDGTGQDLTQTHRLSDAELMSFCSEPFDMNERGRLILRKRHTGEPDEEELRKASAIALEEQNEVHANALSVNNSRSKAKVQQLTGEAYPLSQAKFAAGPRSAPRDRSNSGSANVTLRPVRSDSRPRPRIKEYLGGRPPSELISSELTTYFPDHRREAIERTVRMSMRRSARLSKAASRISVASNGSFGSGLMKDAPPLPSIADAWLTGAATGRGPRPLSVSRFGSVQGSHRDSVASSSLQPLVEESTLVSSEPNRKSYYSFDSDSQAGGTEDRGGESDTNATTLSSYFDESGSSGPTTEAGGSLHDHLSKEIAIDGEEPDEELTQFLRGDSWDNLKWMKGALIGQGSFGSVFLALHSVTGELMAVKQVEVPSNANSVLDKKKESMVAALKREIDLLRDLQHENIVQYLGSNSDEEHFNIFLEYVPGGSVAGLLNQYGSLQEPLIRNFVRQILAGLSYLHGRDIIHRDIKGANVLVDNKGVLKISDFGISKRVEASQLLAPQGKSGGHMHRPSLQGSVFWMAPEVVQQTSYTRKADIWSLGCLIVEMFTGTHPFPNCSQLQAIFQIGNSCAKPNVPESASDEGKEFLGKTFEIDQNQRPSADELLLSPFLKPIA